jgi:hypothetical protein
VFDYNFCLFVFQLHFVFIFGGSSRTPTGIYHLLGPSAGDMARYTVQKNAERSLVCVYRDLREQHPSPTSHAQRFPLQTLPVATAASFVPSATTYAAPGPAPAPSVDFRPSPVAAPARAELVSPRYQAKNNDIGAAGPRGANGSAADLQPEAISIGAISELSSSPGVAPAVHAPFPRKASAWHKLWQWYQTVHSQYRLSPTIIGDDPAQPQLAEKSIARYLSSHPHDSSDRIRRVIHRQIARCNARPPVIPAQPEDQAADKRRLLEPGVASGGVSYVAFLAGLPCKTGRKSHSVGQGVHA